MHIDLHTTLSPRTNAFAVSCGQVCRNWKEQPRASPQTRRTEPGALHWQPAINTNDCSLRSRWHPRHNPWNTPAHTYKCLPPAPSLSFPRQLESLIPTPVCHHSNSTHREACHRFRDARAIGKRTHTRSRSHSLTLMHAMPNEGDQTFSRVEQWPLRDLCLSSLAHTFLTACQFLTQKKTLCLFKQLNLTKEPI